MSGDPTQRRDHSPPAPTSGRGAQDYDGHHYPASSGGGGGSLDHSGRPHPLGGRFRFAVQVKATGELVTIIDKRYESGRQVLEAEDGRLFTPHAHSIGVVEVEEPE